MDGGEGGADVEHLVAAEQRDRDVVLQAGVAPSPRESRARAGDVHIGGDDVEIAGLPADAVANHLTTRRAGARRQRGGLLIAGIHHGKAIRWKGLNGLVERAGDALDGAEALQVLRPDRGDQGITRLHQRADGGDLSGSVRVHLDDEGAVTLLEVVVDGLAAHAHQRVEALRCCQRRPVPLEHVREDVLGRGLPVAPGHGEHQRMELLDAAACAAEEAATNRRLDGPVDDIGCGQEQHGQRC